jgi:hypothetical protein
MFGSVKPPLRYPGLMPDAVVRHIECEQHSFRGAGSRKVIFIGTVYHPGISRGEDIHVPCAQAEGEGSSHGVLVEVQPRLAHRRFGSLDNLRSQSAVAASSWAMSASISSRLA